LAKTRCNSHLSRELENLPPFFPLPDEGWGLGLPGAGWPAPSSFRRPKLPWGNRPREPRHAGEGEGRRFPWKNCTFRPFPRGEREGTFPISASSALERLFRKATPLAVDVGHAGQAPLAFEYNKLSIVSRVSDDFSRLSSPNYARTARLSEWGGAGPPGRAAGQDRRAGPPGRTAGRGEQTFPREPAREREARARSLL